MQMFIFNDEQFISLYLQLFDHVIFSYLGFSACLLIIVFKKSIMTHSHSLCITCFTVGLTWFLNDCNRMTVNLSYVFKVVVIVKIIKKA